MLILKILDFFYLDGYKSLWDKYHDPDRELFEEERHSAYNNYKYYMGICSKNKDFKMMLRMRRAKKEGDYLELYDLQNTVNKVYM